MVARVTATKTFTFHLPDDMKAGLRAIKERDGISEGEQIRRGVRLWLDSKAVTRKKKTERRGRRTAKRS